MTTTIVNNVGEEYFNYVIFQLFVTFDKMHDPDMSDAVRAMDVVNLYEWAIGDDIGLHTQWNVVSNYTEITNKQV